MTGWLRWLVLALLALGAILFAHSHVADLRAAAGLLREARPWPLLAALLFQALYYVFATVALRGCLRLVDFQTPFGWTLRAAFLLIFISRLVPGPAAAGPAAIYILLERRGLSKARSALVGPLFYAVDLAAFLTLLATGLGMLWLRGEGGGAAWAAAPAIAALAGGAAGLAWLLRRPRRLESFLTGVSRFLNNGARILRAPWRVPESAASRLTFSVEAARSRLRARPVIGFGLAGAGLAMALCDVASMACCFLAFGVWLGVPTAFLGFCLATTGALASVLPGGLGTFDATMVLGFTALGVSRAPTLAATVAYRLLATWLPAALGILAVRAFLASAEDRRGKV